MNNYFDKPVDRKNTHCVKWDYVEKHFGGKDILPMWVADMDFPAPPEIINSIHKRAEHGVFGYTERPDELHNSIINWMKKKHRWDIRKEWIVYTPGVVPALNIAVFTLTAPGDSVIIQPPVYPPFLSVARNHNRHTIMNQLILKDNRYYMDFEDLENKMAAGAKMMILCSPHNPVGRVWSKDELNRVIDLCQKYHVLLVSDEIHSDIIYPQYQHIPIASLSEEQAEYSITCIAPSKTFNIPGLTLSAAIIPNPELRMQFCRTIDRFAMGSSNIFGITASEAAYTYGDNWLNGLIEYLEGNLKYLQSYIDERIPEIKVVHSEGTYLVWLDCRELGMDGPTLKDFMVTQAHLGLNDGTDFGPGGEGFLRMNIACPRSTLVEGLKRLETAIQKQRIC